MKSEFDSSQHLLVLAAALISHGIFAAENAPTTRCLLPAPPANAGSVAEPPTAADTGAPQSANVVRAADLPPVPPGVTELKFSEFFRQPVGSRGLEFTEKARSLDGKRVRVCGYMVRQAHPVERCLLLTPVPLTLHEEEYGFAEDRINKCPRGILRPSRAALKVKPSVHVAQDRFHILSVMILGG